MNYLSYQSKDKFLRTWASERPYLNGAHLKYIAMFFMLLSHIAQTYFLYNLGPDYWKLADIFVFVGRISMPIFCFFTVQAIIFSRNISKYFVRMIIFALVSEIPFNLAFFDAVFYPERQNVILTLLLGAVAVYAVDDLWKSDTNDILKILFAGLIVYLAYSLSNMWATDYAGKGIIAVFLLYLGRTSKIGTALALLVGFYFEFQVYGWVIENSYGFVYLAIPLLLLYNGKRGKQNKWAFYVFYPAHLFILYLLKLFII